MCSTSAPLVALLNLTWTKEKLCSSVIVRQSKLTYEHNNCLLSTMYYGSQLMTKQKGCIVIFAVNQRSDLIYTGLRLLLFVQ